MSNSAKITMTDIESNIVREAYFTAADGIRGRAGDAGVVSQEHSLLTFCVLTLKNGFTVTGESACVSPANFDEAMGRIVARQHAFDKIWPLMGYELKSKLAGGAA